MGRKRWGGGVVHHILKNKEIEKNIDKRKENSTEIYKKQYNKEMGQRKRKKKSIKVERNVFYFPQKV